MAGKMLKSGIGNRLILRFGKYICENFHQKIDKS